LGALQACDWFLMRVGNNGNLSHWDFDGNFQVACGTTPVSLWACDAMCVVMQCV
jgi:hypothetical protein